MKKILRKVRDVGAALLISAAFVFAVPAAAIAQPIVVADTIVTDAGTVTAVAVGTALAGVLTPFITAIINQPRFSSQTKAIIAALVGIVLGVVAVAVTGGFSALPWTQWGPQILAVVGVSQTLYALILKAPVEAIERATAGSDH